MEAAAFGIRGPDFDHTLLWDVTDHGFERIRHRAEGGGWHTESKGGEVREADNPHLLARRLASRGR